MKVLMNSKLLATTLAALTLACILQPNASAQNVGTLRGTVTDPSAAVIPNATVVATGNGLTRSVKTDGQGKYTIPNVPPGKYDVRADAPGFVPSFFSEVEAESYADNGALGRLIACSKAWAEALVVTLVDAVDLLALEGKPV